MAFELGKLKRRQQRGHDHIRDEDIESAQQREAQAQQALAAARQRTQHARDVLLSLDAVQYPEARYYADTEAGRAPPNGLGLLHASGLFVDRRLDTDYEVGGTALRNVPDDASLVPCVCAHPSPCLPRYPRCQPGPVAGERGVRTWCCTRAFATHMRPPSPRRTR